LQQVPALPKNPKWIGFAIWILGHSLAISLGFGSLGEVYAAFNFGNGWQSGKGHGTIGIYSNLASSLYIADSGAKLGPATKFL
jgi:hypothetical protein